MSGKSGRGNQGPDYCGRPQEVNMQDVPQICPTTASGMKTNRTKEGGAIPIMFAQSG